MKPPRDWLMRFLGDCLRGFDHRQAGARFERFAGNHPDLERREAIRRYYEERLRETGLVYGTPLAAVPTIVQHTDRGGRRRATFMAILKLEIDLVLELGCLVDHCPEPERQLLELLVLLALLRERWRLAVRLQRWLDAGHSTPPPRTLVRRVERHLWRQAYLAGNPLLGLPVHNSLAYVEAKTLGRLAIAYYENGLQRDSLQRVLDYRRRERLLLLQAMVGLAQADRPLDAGSIAVMAEQLRRAGVDRRTRRLVEAQARDRLPPVAVAALVADDRTRDFLVEQVLLGAMLDGHYSQKESVFIADLAGWLGVGAEELARRESRVLAFYETNKDFLDLFMVGSAVRWHRQRWLRRLQAAIAENADRIVGEIRSTRQLAELLGRAAGGEQLTREQRREMVRRLIDILRAIPSLAIFALPGGAVLLPLVFKFLPDELKPRSFAEAQQAGADDFLDQSD